MYESTAVGVIKNMARTSNGKQGAESKCEQFGHMEALGIFLF